jgi:hypothetical protein
LEYFAAAEFAANRILESSCGESIHLHQNKELCRDATTSDSQRAQLKHSKSAAKKERNIFHALCSCLDVKENVYALAW